MGMKGRRRRRREQFLSFGGKAQKKGLEEVFPSCTERERERERDK